jgi:hypothetical protein
MEAYFNTKHPIPLDKRVTELEKKVGNTPIDKATKSKFGIVKIGNNIDVVSSGDNEGTISIPFASASQAGVTRLSGEAVTEGTASNYSDVSSYGGTAMVRKADSDNYGVVKIGDGLDISNGVINITDIVNRLSAVEELAEISIEGGEIEVANSASDIVPGSSKIPTANAIAGVLNSVIQYEIID